MTKTFYGRIEDTLDALVIFEACRQGVLPKLNRRLVAAEKGEIRQQPYDPEAPTLSITPPTTSSSSSSGSSKHQTLARKVPSPPPPLQRSHFQSQNLITPGSVFVFDETEAKICRWTDGRIWSPSRICGNFLVYHELYRKLPSQKCRSARDKAGVRDGHGLKDMALRKKVEQDGLVVLGSRKGTFVLKKDGLIKKTICVEGISLPSPEKMKGRPLVVVETTTAPPKMGRGRGAKTVESRVPRLNFTGTQHLICYEQAGAMAGLYRPRDYVELREISMSKTFITSQKFRDPVQVKPLPAGQKPVEPSDEYISQTRITEVRTPSKAIMPSAEANAARSASATTRKGSDPATRFGRKRGTEPKPTTVLTHPYPTRGQDRQLREVLEESQIQESSDSESRSASSLPDQTNEGHAELFAETTRRDPSYPENTPQLYLQPLAQEQIYESNRREYDDTMEGPSGQTSRNAKRHGWARAQDWGTNQSTLNREQDHERPFRRADNDATEGSSSNSSPVTITNSTSLSSSLTLSPATAPRDEPRALYSDPLSPTESMSNSENMDMDIEEAAQTLQQASTRAYFSPRQCSIPNGTYPYRGHYGDASEDSIRALLFEPDPMTPSYRLPPYDAQGRYTSNNIYPPPSGPLAYLEDHHYSPAVSGNGEFRRWYPPYPPPRNYYGDRHYTIPDECPAAFVPNYMMPPRDENYGAGDDYSSSDVVSSDSFERTPVHHEFQNDIPDGYGSRPNEYQMMLQQVLQRQLPGRLQLHQLEEQQRIEFYKHKRYDTSDNGPVGYHHSNAISSPPAGGASESESRGTMSGDEDGEGMGSGWTTDVDFIGASKFMTEQTSFGGVQLVREQMPDSYPADNAQVIEWVDSDDDKERYVRHAISPVDGADMASESGGHQPSSRAQDWTPSDTSKVSDYSEPEQPIGGAQQWSSSLFGPEFPCKRRQRSSSREYLASIDYVGLKSPAVDNRAGARRLTTLNHTPIRCDSSQPIQIMSHVHINHRRRPSITSESTKPAENNTITSMDTNEYLLYSHHQPATFEVVQEDTMVSHDEPPSAHLVSEEDPFFSDLRARGIGGRSCLAVHASSSPAEPSSADGHGCDEPRDGSAQS